MKTSRLKLPLGIQTFEEIITDNYIYVDKTRYLIDLIKNGKVYFFARPRRFGKSLTISTFEAIFLGKKHLFKGLYAEEYLNSREFKASPVIRLDMSKVTTHRGLEALDNSIKELILEISEILNIKVPTNLPGSDIFRKLILDTAKKYNQKIVILVDEYDSPYTEFVNDTTIAKSVRDILRNYYIQIKANDEYIRFVFITGISKFARMGVFSTLNTATDISLMFEYAEMCGYTEEEIIKYFPDYLEETATYMKITPEELIAKMRYYYNGFCFDGNVKARLYNPFSTLAFFKEKEFYNYWIETGRSKLIGDYMKNQNLTVEQFRNYPVSRDFAKSPGDVDETPPAGFFYQCGYLTLRPGISDVLSLDYPNTEVLNSMSALVAQNILNQTDNDYTFCRNDLLKGLMTLDYKKVVSSFNRLLASIPYDDFAKAAQQSISVNDYEFKPQEWLYRSTILAFLRGCGVFVAGEMHTNKGRSDIVVFHKEKTWIIELKVAYENQCPAQKAKEAFQQITEKNYAKSYPNAFCIGMAIDDIKREITEIMVN